MGEPMAINPEMQDEAERQGAKATVNVTVSAMPPALSVAVNIFEASPKVLCFAILAGTCAFIAHSFSSDGNYGPFIHFLRASFPPLSDKQSCKSRSPIFIIITAMITVILGIIIAWFFRRGSPAIARPRENDMVQSAPTGERSDLPPGPTPPRPGENDIVQSGPGPSIAEAGESDIVPGRTITEIGESDFGRNGTTIEPNNGGGRPQGSGLAHSQTVADTTGEQSEGSRNEPNNDGCLMPVSNRVDGQGSDSPQNGTIANRGEINVVQIEADNPVDAGTRDLPGSSTVTELDERGIARSGPVTVPGNPGPLPGETNGVASRPTNDNEGLLRGGRSDIDPSEGRNEPNNGGPGGLQPVSNLEDGQGSHSPQNGTIANRGEINVVQIEATTDAGNPVDAGSRDFPGSSIRGLGNPGLLGEPNDFASRPTIDNQGLLGGGRSDLAGIPPLASGGIDIAPSGPTMEPGDQGRLLDVTNEFAGSPAIPNPQPREPTVEPDSYGLRLADHIYVYKILGISQQHGIYVGNGMIIHFGPAGEPDKPVHCRMCKTYGARSRGVKKSCFDCFVADAVGRPNVYRYGVREEELERYNKGGTCSRAQENGDAFDVISRADFLLEHGGFGDYDPIKRNSESFAVYCKTKRLFRSSSQVDGIWAGLSRFFTANMVQVDWHHFSNGDNGVEVEVEALGTLFR